VSKRLGVTIPPHNSGLTTGLLSSLVRSAESLGYEAAFLPEAWSYDTTTVMMRCAMESSSIKIGSAILPIEARTPAQTAMAAVAIDDASDGRLILGLGVGHRHKEENWHGLNYNPSVGRFREYVEIVREITSGKEMSYEGNYLKCTDYRLGITPVRPTIPVYLAALGLRTHRLVGEMADGVLAYYAAPGWVEVIVNTIRQGAESAGRALEDIDVCLMIPTQVTDDPEPALELARKQIAWYNAFENYNYMFRMAGFVEEANALKAAWEKVRERDPDLLEWQEEQGNDCGTACHVSDEMVESIFVIGDEAKVAQRIDSYRSLGVTMPIVFPQGTFSDVKSAMASYLRTMSAASTMT